MTQPRLLGGRYELDGVIGRGGMAEVYKARDLRLDRIVAIKTLRSDMARDPTFQARFRREAQSAASLNHPSVIAVYDTGEDVMGDTMIPYIVMEFVEGHTLRDLLRENRRLRPEKALEITDGILRALDYSHRGGIIHRDIKPANVMLTRAHEVKVMDFGIARAMADSAATMTQTAQVIGTAQYLSPEQARGERVDARSDLYSTGCVLYELLTGRPPFTGDSPVAIAYQHVREEPIPPSQVDPEIPQWCDAIVLKAMAKDANMRYQSANEFRSDIQRAMQGMPVSATAASTMVMGAGGMPQGGYTPTQIQRQAPAGYDLPPVTQHGGGYGEDPERNDTGKKVAIWLGLAVLFIGGAALIGYLLTSGGGGSPSSTNSPTSTATSAAQVSINDESGKSVDEATSDLTSQGLKVSDNPQTVNDDTVPKCKVIKTDPAAGQTVDKGSTVTLYVSKGKAKQNVQVPTDLAGKSYADAKAELEGQGLKVSKREQTDETVDAGKVISSNPDGGSTVTQGSTVVLTVSTGSANTTVPDVTNSTPQAACNKIKAQGLKCAFQRTPNPSVSTETVYQTSPAAGETIAKGETVTIFVYVPLQQSSGPPNNGGN